MPDSVDTLRQSLRDSETRSAISEILGIITLLGYCIIDKNYRVSDDWAASIKLSPFGDRILREFMERQKRVKPNDAKMAVFLEFGCTDGLLVDPSIDIERLRYQLSREVLKGNIYFPYIFGRELHDAAAKLFPRKTQLNNQETIQLLRRLPIGVFQEGCTIVGPYGCTYSDVPRNAGPTFTVPGYLCSDESCQSIHTLDLKTGDTSVSKARRLLGDYLEANTSQSADEHAPLIRDALVMEFGSVSPYSTTNLIDVLSDGLSVVELRMVIDYLLRRTFKETSRRRDVAKRLNAAIANPAQFVEGLDRAQLMQIALIHSDRDIMAAIDAAIRSKGLRINEFELRVSKIRRWDRDALDPSAQIGPLGVRFSSPPSSRLVVKNMLRLLHSIYYESDQWDAADLAYSLEAPASLNDGELLDRAVRQYTPAELFERLVLPNRRVMIMTADKLGVFDCETMSREEILERLRWKIGEPSTAGLNDLRRLNDHLVKLKTANNEHQDEDVLRSHAINLTTALEDALSRALKFSVWMLTEDHYLSTDGFSYDPLLGSSVLEFIETNAPTQEAEIRLKVNSGNALKALGAGFARLAKALRKLDPSMYRRPEEHIPATCAALSQPFAFPFTIPFLNLAQLAQPALLTLLQEISRLVQRDDVINLRNAVAHGDRELPFPTTEDIDRVIGYIDRISDRLRSTGLYPRIYDLTSISRDNYGREALLYEDDGEHITFHRPSWEISPRLPLGQSQLIIVPSARTTSSGPLRFRLNPRPGGDPYWDGWPIRWSTKTDYTHADRPALGPDEFSQTA